MAERKPLVSVGMPLYNEERYLRQALNALLAQDYENFELIISDNASEDGTSQICQEWAAKDQRIRYFRNESNIGAARNFQKVFEFSRGDYFAWAAGHDLWHPAFLSSCAEVLSQDESVVLSYPQAVWIGNDDQPIGVMPSSVETRGLDTISRFHVVLWGMGYCYPIYGVIRAQALKQTRLGLQVIGPDNILLAELSLLGTFAHLPKPLFYVRKMEDFGRWDKYIEKVFNNRSSSGLSAHSLYWQMIDEHLKTFSKHIHTESEKTAITLSTALCLLTKYSWVLHGIGESSTQLPDSTGDVYNRIETLALQIQNSANTIEKMFVNPSEEEKIPTPLILIDGVFFQLYQTGIARVWRSLLEEWAGTDFAQNLLILDRAGTAPKIPGLRYLTIQPYDYNNTHTDREMLQQVCDEQGANLFISTYYTTPLSTPSVFMAYDMIPEVLGADFNEPMWREKHYAIRHASAYISISENTARDLAKFFPDIELKPITVAHCGVKSSYTPASSEEINTFRIKYGISKPYFLSVGGGAGYKNTILFLKAFSSLCSRLGFEIVLTGSRLILEGEFRAYTSGNVVHLLQLSDDELKAAYSGAVALVYPSKYEGFGLPVLEAMSCGCPVITCPNASIPEVAGEAVLYVNDEDVNGMANALCDVQKSDIRQSLIAVGLQQAKKFSWTQMAKKVSSALIEATLIPLKLNNINLIIFPDWSRPEELLGLELEGLVRAVLNHADYCLMTLLVDISNASEEDANLILSSVTMNLLMQEDLDIEAGPEISLVGQLDEMQWKALLPRLHASIILENEDKQASARMKAETIPSYDVNSLSNKRAVQSEIDAWILG